MELTQIKGLIRKELSGNRAEQQNLYYNQEKND